MLWLWRRLSVAAPIRPLAWEPPYAAGAALKRPKKKKKKRCSTYIQWNTNEPFKKNKIMPFAATWMELEILILSEVSQKEKDKYHVIPLISGI